MTTSPTPCSVMPTPSTSAIKPSSLPGPTTTATPAPLASLRLAPCRGELDEISVSASRGADGMGDVAEQVSVDAGELADYRWTGRTSTGKAWWISRRRCCGSGPPGARCAKSEAPVVGQVTVSHPAVNRCDRIAKIRLDA